MILLSTFLIPLSLGKNIPKYFLLLYCAFGKYLKKKSFRQQNLQEKQNWNKQSNEIY